MSKPRIADLAALAAIVLIITAAFADILFSHKVLFARDVARGFYPAFAVLRESLQQGAFPFWNRHYAAGQPLAANPAYGALYPPQWIASIFATTRGFHIEIVGHYVFAAIGMYVLLRSMRLRPLSSLFGAISFALGGVLLSLSNLVTVLFGVSWFPWLAYAGRRFFHHRRARDFALTSLSLGAILLVGDQAVILQAGFLLAGYAISFRQFRAIALAAALVAAAIAVGSVQIIPALDHQRDSLRAAPLPYAVAAQWTLPAVRPLELALPSLFGVFRDFTYYWAADRFYPKREVPWVFSFYSGLLVFVLACAGAVRRVRGWLFTVSFLAFSYALSVYPLLYVLGLRSVRYPEKFFVSGVFVLVVFAAVTADRLLDDEAVRRTAAGVALIVWMGAIASLAWTTRERFARTWQLTGYFDDSLAQAGHGALVTIATAVALAAILAVRRLVSARVRLALLSLFVLADLAPRVRGLTPRIDASFYNPPPVARALRGARIYNDAAWRLLLLPTPRIPIEQRPWRVRNGLQPEMQAIWGMDGVLEDDVARTNLIHSAQFSEIYWKAQFERRTDLVPLLLAMCGTTHVADLRDATSADNPIQIIPLANSRFYFADQVLPSTDILRGGQRSSRVAFLDGLKPVPHSARIIRAVERPNAVDLDVDADGDALLVIAVTRHKYWRAAIDGAETTLYPTNVAFQSVLVSRGRHHVSLRYRNPLIVIFGIVSIVSVAILVVFALRSKESPPPSPH